MIKQLKYLLIIFFTAGLSLAQVKLEVIVQSPEIDSLENIFITGNQIEFGNWNPGLVSLNKFKEAQWRKIFYLPQNTQVEFKFTKGSWDSEALDEKGSIPGIISFTLKRDTTLFLVINNWKDLRENLSGQVTGKVIYHKNFEGRKVLPRDIVVWLPPGYDSAINKFYPVLYMHDGQNLFDPSTSSFGIDWQMDETTDSLIRKNEIKEIIIVGIYNTYKRRTEYANTNDGYNYINFIIEELKPFIDKTYRTLPDRINTATGGSSMGGLISFIITWQYWDVFSKAACLSPAFKVSEFDYVSTVKEDQMAKKPVKFYIDNGGVGLEEKLLPGINEMLNLLNDKGYKNGEDIYWYYDKTAEHNESAWAKRAWRFLKFLFPRNR
jgi:predicted alpha/beta superfamily hydrolase